MKCLSASGQLGYGIPAQPFFEGLARSPDVIGADLGSIDPGPFFLGSGQAAATGASLRRDLRLVLEAARDLHVPLLLGSAGTAGARPHVREVRRVIEELAAELGVFEMAVITSDLDAETLVVNAADGKVQPCGPAPPLRDDDVRAATGLVAQMGVEPFQAAIKAGAQIVLAGRACDAAVFSAVPRMTGHAAGASTHMAKIIECTSLCAEPGGREAALGIVDHDSFTVESMADGNRCTVSSVASHAMYEQDDPTVIREPGGVVDLTSAIYEQVDDRIVRVHGSRWISDETYRVKVEGARLRGYRAISLGGMRDRYLIAALPEALAGTEEKVHHVFAGTSEDYSLAFRTYGRGSVLGDLEPDPRGEPDEVLVVTDVVADTLELAVGVCGVAKQNLLHISYPGMRSNGANMAIPFGPDVIPVGPVYEFCVYHLLELTEPTEVFPMELVTIGNR